MKLLLILALLVSRALSSDFLVVDGPMMPDVPRGYKLVQTLEKTGQERNLYKIDGTRNSVPAKNDTLAEGHKKDFVRTVGDLRHAFCWWVPGEDGYVLATEEKQVLNILGDTRKAVVNGVAVQSFCGVDPGELGGKPVAELGIVWAGTDNYKLRATPKPDLFTRK